MLAEATRESIKLAYDTYKLQIDVGVAREQARNVLPLATYTEMYWKIDLHNLLHFLRLRLDSHAQKEIREFAQAIYDIVRDWVPITAQAFEDYVLYGVSFSAQELAIIKHIACGKLGIVYAYKADITDFTNWTQVAVGAGDCEEEIFARSRSFSELQLEERSNLLISFGITNKREQQEFYAKLEPT